MGRRRRDYYTIEQLQQGFVSMNRQLSSQMLYILAHSHPNDAAHLFAGLLI